MMSFRNTDNTLVAALIGKKIGTQGSIDAQASAGKVKGTKNVNFGGSGGSKLDEYYDRAMPTMTGFSTARDSHQVEKRRLLIKENKRPQVDMKTVLNLGDRYVFHKESTDSNITIRGGNLKSLSNNKRQCSKNYHMMYDRRIARGNTFCFTSEAVLAMAGDNVKRRRVSKKKSRLPNDRPLTPPPVCGRVHNISQTDCVLEELWEKPPTDEVLCQTDPFMDRPESPIFIPAKTGMDIETQIYPGELFDFDTEVRPITELLVGKTMEQSLLEVMEEEELEALRYQQRRYEERRRAELLEQQRLEEQEKRLEDEKKRRILQHHEALRIQREAERRLKASYFTIRYLRDLVPLNNLNREGYFVSDATEDEIKNMFMPWLMREVRSELEVKKISRNLLDDMIRHYTTHRCDDYHQINEMDLNPPIELDFGEGDGYFCDNNKPVGDYDDLLPKL